MDRLGLKKDIAWVNSAIIILNILYFLFLEAAGSSEDARTMIQYGALYIPMVIGKNEYYRLATAVFMHFGIHHLVNNMLVLFVLGDKLERAIGRMRYLILYLASGIGANAVSAVFYLRTSPNVVSAGASGAIFGVVGGLIYVVIANRGRLEDLSTRQIVLMAIFSLYLGYISTGTNNTAHLSGVFIGLVMAVLLYRRPRVNFKTAEKREEGGNWDYER